MGAAINGTPNQQIHDTMGGVPESTPRIDDLFVIIEIMKKYRMYEHEVVEHKNAIDGLKTNALEIIDILKNGGDRAAKFTLQRSINDYSKRTKWKFPMARSFPNIEQLKGSGTKKTILQHAVENYNEADKKVKKSLKDVIQVLTENCPDLIISAENGAAPLLTVILMQSRDLLELMLSALLGREVEQGKDKQITTSDMERINIKLKKISFGNISRGRILCTCSVYHVTALMLNKDMFQLFLDHCGELCILGVGRFGDNLLHALVRYSSKAPSKTVAVIDMLQHLHNLEKYEYRNLVHGLWMQSNGSGLSPLQLAAKKGQHRIFEFIMSLEMLYYFRDGDEDCFDVTEIDSVPDEDPAANVSERNTNDNSPNTQQIGARKSVLHLIRHVSDKYSIPIANMPSVKAVIDAKWVCYRRFIRLWFGIHLLLMGLCTWYATIRAQLKNPFVNNGSKNVDTAYGLGICVLIYGIFCLIMQIIRNINKFRRKRKIISSFMFPWIFGLVGVLIVLDFVFACTVASYGNFLLPYVLIFGWGLSLNFLQVIHYFSVFVVMIQRLVSIMIQFAIVASLFMVGFSAAAYLALHDAELENDDDKFKHFGKTCFKMFTLMIALGDLDEVFDAEYLIITISIFVMFSLLTSILLLNALIAYMSEVCSLVAEYGKRGSISSKVYARLQRVTVIVQLEDFFTCLFDESGENRRCFNIFSGRQKKIYNASFTERTKGGYANRG